MGNELLEVIVVIGRATSPEGTFGQSASDDQTEDFSPFAKPSGSFRSDLLL